MGASRGALTALSLDGWLHEAHQQTSRRMFMNERSCTDDGLQSSQPDLPPTPPTTRGCKAHWVRNQYCEQAVLSIPSLSTGLLLHPLHAKGGNSSPLAPEQPQGSQVLQPMATAALGKGQFSISAPGASQLQPGSQARPLVSSVGGEVLPEISSAKEGGS